VTEIKETVANQVQAVKETLDWREQFKKRPVAWSAGAMGVGFLIGYGLAAMAKSDGGYAGGIDRFADESKSYAAQPVLRASAVQADTVKQGNGKHDEGPGLFERLTSTPAYERVKHEAGNVGDALVQELTKTAKQLVLPALMTSLRNFIGGYLPSTRSTTSESSSSSTMRSESDRARSGTASAYQPTLERNQS
jgi:hypothetical protein